MKKLSLLLFFWGAVMLSFAQNVTITPGGITPAMTGAYPRISYDAILALPNPSKGDMAFDMTFNCLRVYTGSKWICTFQSPTDPTPNMTAIAQAGGTASDAGSSIVVDGSGNVYVIGMYKGTATFGTTTLTSAGNHDVFVAKYNGNGALQWIQKIGGVGWDSGYDIAVDGSGNVYVTGDFSGTASFGTITLTSAGFSDVFVAKYNGSGALQWVQKAGGANGSDTSGLGVAADGSGNVYVTGRFSGTVGFGTTTITSAGDRDVFVAKYNNIGALQWVQRAGGTGWDNAQDLTVDDSGNVYVIGFFEGTATFGTTTLTSAGNWEIFVAKYNSSTLQWAQKAGGAGFDSGNDIAVDGSGNIYVTGWFQGTASFGTINLTSAGNNDVFVAKYNGSGAIQWVQKAGGTISDYGNGIAVDGSGNIYVTGFFQGTASFGTINLTSAGGIDGFVAKYNGSGAPQWVQKAGGANDSDSGNDIAVDGSGNVYFTGSFSDIATFGTTTLTSAGATDIFVARIDK